MGRILYPKFLFLLPFLLEWSKFYSHSLPILGCTELPVLAQKIGISKEYIDPSFILAKCCVERAKGMNDK